MTETSYQRIGREQRERQKAREARMRAEERAMHRTGFSYAAMGLTEHQAFAEGERAVSFNPQGRWNSYNIGSLEWLAWNKGLEATTVLARSKERKV